jgi:hypothetical protein
MTANQANLILKISQCLFARRPNFALQYFNVQPSSKSIPLSMGIFGIDNWTINFYLLFKWEQRGLIFPFLLLRRAVRPSYFSLPAIWMNYGGPLLILCTFLKWRENENLSWVLCLLFGWAARLFFFPFVFQTNHEDSFDYIFFIFHIKCMIFESEKPAFSYLGIGMTMEFGPEYFCD